MPTCPHCKFKWVAYARSNPQNKWYRGVVLEMISEETGHDPDDLHELFKYKFNSSEVMGKRVGKTTVNLTVKEFTEYVENIRRWAAEFLSMNIPDPDERCKDV